MKIRLITLCLSSLFVVNSHAQRQQSHDYESSDGSSSAQIKQIVYGWHIVPPLGLREPADVDTSLVNYGQRSIPASLGPAYATTGNLGGPGQTMIFFDRKPMSKFMFRDAIRAWLPSIDTQEFFNSRVPMTLVSYNTSGSRDNSQERLSTIFSGNINKQAQIGALCDLIYSKGSYDFQATKGFTWGLSGSYIGDHYEMQAFYNHWNFVGNENGGITDDRYITDPAQLQGGITSIQPKSIPTRLSAAYNRVVGGEFYMTNTYKLGFEHDVTVDSSTTVTEFVPATSFTWTLGIDTGRRGFTDTSAGDTPFWKNTYYNLNGSRDITRMTSVSNTVGVSMLEGFHRFAKFGLSAFATFETRGYTQAHDTIVPSTATKLTALPVSVPSLVGRQNLLWVGGQLTKQRGALLTYDATGRIGLAGDVIGDIDIDGKVATRLPIFSDTLAVGGYGQFHNTAPSYLLNSYVSNHFIWQNNFDKTRSLRLGGIVDFSATNSHINAGVENVQNIIYFNASGMPVQYDGHVQVLNVAVKQNFKFGPMNWDNSITYQETSNSTVIPLPKLAIYSNMYFRFGVAHALDVQLGVDCNYFTKYKAVSYQPATMMFVNQDEIECGNFPVANLYANMKLSKARFYVLLSHFNQGLFGSNFFSMPHYPINPRRFQIGVSVDFNN